jgi:3-oxoacyl-[acyl-carrier protein] reductase
VTIAARRKDVLETAAEMLRAEIPGATVTTAVSDVLVEEQVQSAVEAATAGSGRLDVAVANAGSGALAPFLEASIDAWRYACNLNVIANAMLFKHAGRAMKQHGGSIVAISSVQGSVIARYMAPYTVTKAALEWLARCAALELAPHRIRVNAIQVGYVPSEGTSMAFDETDVGRLIELTPLGRAGTGEEVGEAIVYLSADSGSWVTGQVFAVDGGMTLPEGPEYERLCRRALGDALMDRCQAPARSSV